MKLGAPIVLMLAALVLLLMAGSMVVTEAKPAGALDLGGRTLLMVEGYGARCAVLFNDEGMGSAGSGTLACDLYYGSSYRGDWRPVQPRSE